MDEHELKFDARTIVSTAERVAVLETQNRALAESINSLRMSQHAMANEQQKQIAVNAKMLEQMERVLRIAEQLPAINSAVHDFERMQTTMQKLSNEYHTRSGQASAVRLLGALLVGTAVVAASFTTFIAWAMGAFK